MVLELGTRMMREVDPRLLWKIAYNFGWKGMRSVERHKQRIKKGEYFPPFLYISIINSCNLRCQGCWVDVAGPQQKIETGDLNKMIAEAKKHGNYFYGLLGGEPFMHPGLFDVLERNPDCYFQIFTNGQFITDDVAKRLRKLGNATPLISIEGSQEVSDVRRGRKNVLSHSMEGLKNCVKNKLITGVATSVCGSNIDDLVNENWLRELIKIGAHYVWFHTYRPVGPDPSPELALTPEQLLQVRTFMVKMRKKLPLIVVDAYWDDKGEALCPMATGISHHISPGGDIEPCPIIQFATDSIHSEAGLYETLTGSAMIKDFREVAAAHTQGCIVLERPDIVKELVEKHGARDTSGRETGIAELDAMSKRHSQYLPGQEVPEEHWMYRFAKKNWFFGFGAYG